MFDEFTPMYPNKYFLLTNMRTHAHKHTKKESNNYAYKAVNAVRKREMEFSGIVYAGLNRVLAVQRPGPDRSQIMGVTDSVRFHQI